MARPEPQPDLAAAVIDRTEKLVKGLTMNSQATETPDALEPWLGAVDDADEQIPPTKGELELELQAMGLTPQDLIDNGDITADAWEGLQD